MSHYRHHPQLALPIRPDIIVDNFAGGGGASTGIEAALGRPVDIAINHNQRAIDMHTVNHPLTQHYCESVWDVDPRQVCQNRAVSLAWFSPDCRHHSRAKGGKPVDKNIRGLAWVAMRWAGTVQPGAIMLENVEEFAQWGPLVPDKNGDLVPCVKRKGFTFRSFVRNLERRGYKVDFQTLVASHYGAPTSRKRLFMVARSDGGQLNWPEPTHGQGLKPYKTAADIIDWSLPCPSIFERKKPLAENTLRRIARGIQKFVIESPEPFVLQQNADGLLVPYIQPYYGDKGPRARGRTMGEPLATQTTENRFSLVSALLAKHYTGVTGQKMEQPIGTITSIDHHSLVTSSMIKLRGTCQHGQPIDQPVPTITASGNHLGEVRAFLIKYYSEGGQWQSLHAPLHTIPTKDRIGLVMVRGEPYQIVDIGMRMLQPHELYAAQSFPDNYVFDRDCHGQPFTKAQQVAMCGNSVPPALAEALVRANMVNADQAERAA